jgi:hypothetical protein
MAGELSPDRLYYWDGVRWASAVSPDGAWRWDGNTWQPASGARPRTRHAGAIIASIVIASLIVTTFGIYQIAGWAASRAQSLLQSSGVNMTCGDAYARVGSAPAEGDVLCGARLGAALYGADCVELTGTPPGGQFLDAVSNGDWQTISIAPDSSGCRLDAQPDHETMFSITDDHPASSTLIVDFVAAGWEGGLGVQVACSTDRSCVDFSFWGDGVFSLDEGKPGDGFENLTRGRLGELGPPPVPKVGTENRLVLRLYGNRVDVFLNGKGVTHATTRRVQDQGVADFYVDGRDTTHGETVFLKRLYLFESLGSSG